MRLGAGAGVRILVGGGAGGVGSREFGREYAGPVADFWGILVGGGMSGGFGFAYVGLLPILLVFLPAWVVCLLLSMISAYIVESV